MKRVLVIITNPQQASYRLRIEALMPGLAQRGFELVAAVWPKGWFARRKLLRGADPFHAVILQRKMLDAMDASLLRRRARRIFYDLDDAVMFQPNIGWMARLRLLRRMNATSRIVDHVVGGNNEAAALFIQRGIRATVVPTCVDPAHYRVKEHTQEGSISLVWIGSNSTLPYVIEKLPVIEQAARQVPGLRLVTIGDRHIESAKLPLEHRAAGSVESEADDLLRGDIGIAPTPDDTWTRHKSGFKIIQYMAAGLPVIASPVGANAQIVTGETGFSAEKHRHWVEAIVELARDAELRARMGRAGRARVEEHYALDRAVSAWAQLLAD